jgi:hypothetical protein
MPIAAGSAHTRHLGIISTPAYCCTGRLDSAEILLREALHRQDCQDLKQMLGTKVDLHDSM